jgi:two-component system, OmpR family, sensor kinase
MSLPKASATKRSELGEKLRLNLLLVGIALSLLVAAIAYLVKIEVAELGSRLRWRFAGRHSDDFPEPFEEQRMFSREASVNSVGGTRSRFQLGIFGRVYAFSLVLAAIAVAACMMVGQYFIESNMKDQVHSLARWMVEETFDVADKAAREPVLRRLYEQGRVRMTLYDADGAMLGAAGPMFALPGEAQLAELRRAGEQGFAGDEAKLSLAILRDGVLRGYGFVAPADPFSIFVSWQQVLLVLGTIALVAWPLALSLLGPVRALSETMQRFGAGDLSARVARPGGDEIGELARGFNRLADRVRELLQSEKMLLASVSHELRTPLQRVRLALELATDTGVATDAEGRKMDGPYLSSVSADLDELDQLLADILVVARLDPARTASDGLLAKQPVPPDELIAECVERFQAAHPERTLSWLEGPPLAQCEMDPRFVRRALLNLLENAARYSPRSEPIEIAAWCSFQELVVEVRDRGPGVPPELQGRIFEPFFQGDSARGSSSGSGLGLSIVQRIAEAHSGKVSVDSSSAGSTFRIQLPLA